MDGLLFTFVGDTPPEHLSDWKYCGGTSSLQNDFDFPSTLPIGSQVWIAARWLSPTMKPGPAAKISALIAGGALAAA